MVPQSKDVSGSLNSGGNPGALFFIAKGESSLNTSGQDAYSLLEITFSIRIVCTRMPILRGKYRVECPSSLCMCVWSNLLWEVSPHPSVAHSLGFH